MLKRFIIIAPILFSLALSLSVVSLYGQALTPTKNSNKPQNQATSSQEQAKIISDDAKSPVATIPFSVAPNTKIETPNKLENKNDKSSADWWLVYFTAALVAVVFFQFIWMVRQEKWMRINVEIAKKSAEAAEKSADSLPIMERAYIFVKEVRLDPSPNLDNYDELDNPSKIAVGQHYYGVIIENFGKTPAIITRTEIFANVMIPDIPKITGIPSPKMPKIIRTIGSGKEKRFDLDFWIDSKEKLEGVFSFQLRLLCIGCIQYEDIFGDSHETGFCWWYEPITTHEFQFYDHPNNYHT